MILQEIEKAVADLPPDELARFRAWFLEYDAHVRDREIGEDVAAGRLDALADGALSDLLRVARGLWMGDNDVHGRMIIQADHAAAGGG